METADLQSSNTLSLCIAICTRNRARSLGLTLNALEALQLPPDWAISCILVDNGSTDDTGEVLSAYAKASPFPTTVMLESRPGLSAARNAALRSTNADVVAFTDDDCLPAQDWLLALCAHFSVPDAPPVIGGRVELHNPADLPITINTSLQGRLIDAPSMNLTSIMGCNFAFRREVLERIGFFDENLGAGAKFISAEDTDFLYRSLQAGFKLEYRPEVAVRHNHGRRTEADRAKLMRGYAVGRGAMYCKHWRQGDRLALKSMFWDARDSLKAIRNDALPKAHRKLCATQLLQVCAGFVRACLVYGRRDGNAPKTSKK